MKLNFNRQLTLSIIIKLAFNVMTTVFEHWIFASAGTVLVGLLWIFHPVLPENAEPTRKNLKMIRLFGAVLVVMGLITRSYFY